MRGRQRDRQKESAHPVRQSHTHAEWEECQRLSVITAPRVIRLLGNLRGGQEETAGSHRVAIFAIS